MTAGCGSDSEKAQTSTTATSTTATSTTETSTTSTSTRTTADGKTEKLETTTCVPRTSRPFPPRVVFASTTRDRGFKINLDTPKVKFSSRVKFDRATSSKTVTSPVRPQRARTKELQFVFVRMFIRNTGKKSFRVANAGGQFALRSSKGTVYIAPAKCPAGVLYAAKNGLAPPSGIVGVGETRRTALTFVAPKSGKLELISRRGREKQTFSVGPS